MFGEDFSLFDDGKEFDVLGDLNDKQKEAVLHIDGPILVLAGAGSGKTRVLTRRVANLVLNHKVFPSNILAVTFTNKATQEMKERLSGLLGSQTNSLWVSTFHSMSVRILRQHAHHLGYENSFTIYDSKDSQSLIKKIFKDLSINDKEYPVDYVRSRISRAKNGFLFPEDILEKGLTFSKGGMKQEQVVSQIYQEYQKELKQLNAMDFDDLLLNTLRLFKKDKDVLSFYQNKFHYILVDEFQDTNTIQYDIIRLLSEVHKNIFVVGDDDQSIYAFRGAKPTNIALFEKDFKGTVVVKLEQNYRSTANILSASNGIISQNILRKDKKLWTAGKKGELITLYSALDENSEAQYVASKIRELVSSGKYKYKDIACFYRTNAQSRALEEALMSKKILYRIFGTLKFWDRKEIKDIIAYLRLVINENDDQAFLRVVNFPTRGIGAQTIANLMASAKNDGVSLYVSASKIKNLKLDVFLDLIRDFKKKSQDVSLPNLLEFIYEKSTYKEYLEKTKDPTNESRIENIRELVSYAGTVARGESDNEKAISFFMDKVSLAGSDESYESKNAKDENLTDVVSLMTVHLAKGLEFPVVFFTGLEEGLVPHSKTFDLPEELEEERRLCYVGITRAMEKLYLTYAQKRTMYSKNRESFTRKESRFLRDIPNELIERDDEDFYHEGYTFNRNEACMTYKDDSNFDFLPQEYKKKIDKKIREAYGKKSPLSMLQPAQELVETIGNFKKLSIEEVKIGLRVRNPNFGEGIIRDIQGSLTANNPHKIKLCIDFDDIPDQKKLILGKAVFEIL